MASAIEALDHETSGDSLSFSEFLSPAHLKSQDLNFMRRYLATIMKKRDHEKFLTELSPDIHKKILALKKLQIKTMDLDAEFHRKVYDLERDFQKKHEKVFKQRFEIISGSYIPSEEECSLSGSIAGISDKLSKSTINSANESTFEGIPEFWLAILKYVPQLENLVKEHDESILKVI